MQTLLFIARIHAALVAVVFSPFLLASVPWIWSDWPRFVRDAQSWAGVAVLGSFGLLTLSFWIGGTAILYMGFLRVRNSDANARKYVFTQGGIYALVILLAVVCYVAIRLDGNRDATAAKMALLLPALVLIGGSFGCLFLTGWDHTKTWWRTR